MKRRIVLVDPGHGGKFTGAVGKLGRQAKEFYEKDINLKAAGLLRHLLVNVYSPGKTEVILTRESDAALHDFLGSDLGRRCEMEHIIAPACFISIHCNASVNTEASGFEVWTSVGQTLADPLATAIFDHVGTERPASLKMRSDIEDGDPDREKHLYVLDNTRCPAVLVELAFMSNQGDLALLRLLPL